MSIYIYIIAITTKRLPSFILYIPVLFATLYHSTGPKRPPFGPHTGHSVPCRLETSEGHPGYDLNSGTGNQPVPLMKLLSFALHMLQVNLTGKGWHHVFIGFSNVFYVVMLYKFAQIVGCRCHPI